MSKFNIDIVKTHLSTAVLRTAKSIFILEDMKSPTMVNGGYVMIAQSFNISHIDNDVQLTERIYNILEGHNYNAFAFYTMTDDLIRFGGMNTNENLSSAGGVYQLKKDTDNTYKTTGVYSLCRLET